MDVANLSWMWLNFLDIAAVPSGVAGVYFIVDADRRPVYIGEAEDVRARLLEHLSGISDQAPCILESGGIRFAYWPVRGGKKARMQTGQALLDKHPTLCNG